MHEEASPAKALSERKAGNHEDISLNKKILLKVMSPTERTSSGYELQHMFHLKFMNVTQRMLPAT